MTTPTASVLGFAYDSPTVEFPVRVGPGTNFDTAPIKANKGLANLIVLDVQPDSQNTISDYGRVYQWMKLQFPDGQIGWMRGHVIGIQGDLTAFGYGVITTMVHEYTLTRDLSKITAPAKDTVPASSETHKATTEPSKSNAFAEAAKDAQIQGQDKSSQPATPPPTAAPAAAAPTGAPTAIIMSRGDSPTRKGPSTTFDKTGFTIPRGARVPITEVKREDRAQKYRWFHVKHNGQDGWIREDLARYEGDTTALGLPSDLYPAPMGDNRSWVRGFNVKPNLDENLVYHDGWDLSAATGEPMYAGPNGGLVVRSFQCTKCTPDKPSTLMQGYSLGDQSIFRDPAWGYGYGNFITVRYTNDQLPKSTQVELEKRGFPGGTLFVMYAHLEKRLVEEGQTLTGGQMIGTCGNTGNSEASHLHLEVRASRTPDFGSWAKIADGLMDAVILFSR